MKEFEEQQMYRGLSASPLKQVIKPSCEKCPLNPRGKNILTSEHGGILRGTGLVKFPSVYYPLFIPFCPIPFSQNFLPFIKLS